MTADNGDKETPNAAPTNGPLIPMTTGEIFDDIDVHLSGTSEKITDLADKHANFSPIDSGPSHRLGQWRATAICGNDITSSCLYVSALCAVQAGRWTPVALGLVWFILYLFRKVYAEVGSALPLNGGAYNALLNTTTKAKASAAACLTLLSYVATAVISAGEAMEYAGKGAEAFHLIGNAHDFPVFYATIGLLGLFAFLNVVGITESAAVALAIFIFHMLTLATLTLFSAFAVLQDPSILIANLSQPAPGGFARALFFGFSAAMLGISGFESSANFIEEQDKGVFAKTLRNMWWAVLFNPIISLLSLGTVPLHEIAPGPSADNYMAGLLAHMGQQVQGDFLKAWVSIDAVTVLSGAVLTSYVGVTGLVRRMALDRCLPQVLLSENKWRKTNHWIIIGFFILCSSILANTSDWSHGAPLPNVSTLAGVYTVSFLAVMALFAIGNMLLKIKRSRLPRDVHASWPAVVLGLIAVCVGLVGNVIMKAKDMPIFLIYSLVAGAVVAIMFQRINILKAILYMARSIIQPVVKKIDQINDSLTVIYFTKGDNLASLNRAAQYVLANEQTRQLKVVHIYQDEDEIPAPLPGHLRILDHVYPQLRIDFLAVKGAFGPDLIEKLSMEVNVPKNYMFIGTPGDRFPHNLSDLGGVRLIL